MTTFRSTCAAAALAAALLLSAGVVSAAPAMPPGVAAALRSSGLPISSFGIDIRSVDVGASDDLYALNAEQDFLLASTTKLVTSLAALDLLGPEHRWRTGAFATGPVANGRLTGDLVISGGAVGLTSAELLRWFRQMRAQGLGEVTGNIVLDHVALLHERDPAQAPTTAVESQPNGGVPDPKTYNVGKLLVSVKPAVGDRATVIVKPRPANVVVVNDVFMGGGCGAWARWRSAEETRGGAPLQLWVRGRWDKTCGAEDIAYVRPPEDVRLAPELGAAPAAPVAAPRLVADLWAEAGGKLGGRVVEGGEPAAGRRAAGGRWSSEVAIPLVEVMREMNKTSNNLAARSVLLSLGSEKGARGGMLSTAQARMKTWLRTQGLADGDIRVDEGSGQSRAERGKPRAMVQLLVNAWRGVASQAFVDSLPIAGVDGTLRNRMRSGSASGQAFLKTGTLSDTRALAGYVRAKSGRVYAVAAIVTHPNAAKGTPALDALIEWVAREG